MRSRAAWHALCNAKGMKTNRVLLTMVASSLLCASTLSYATDQSPLQTPVAPGTVALKDSKNDQNIPPGSAAQTSTTSPAKDSKKDASTQNTSDACSNCNASATAATKTPQKSEDKTQ